VDDLVGADARQVAVALIGEDEFFGPRAFDSGGDFGRPAVGGFGAGSTRR